MCAAAFVGAQVMLSKIVVLVRLMMDWAFLVQRKMENQNANQIHDEAAPLFQLALGCWLLGLELLMKPLCHTSCADVRLPVCVLIKLRECAASSAHNPHGRKMRKMESHQL